ALVVAPAVATRPPARPHVRGNRAGLLAHLPAAAAARGGVPLRRRLPRQRAAVPRAGRLLAGQPAAVVQLPLRRSPPGTNPAAGEIAPIGESASRAKQLDPRAKRVP